MANETVTAPEQARPTATNRVLRYITRSINKANMEAASGRVARIRAARPEVDQNGLVWLLIKNKCWQAGGVGAVTSSTSLVPGLGTLVALTFGVATDIGLTFKLQAELVLEVAAAYGHDLSDEEKQRIVMVVTGASAGANQALQVAGRQVAKAATSKLAQKSVVKAIPVIGVAASAGTNVVTTYLIGQRAKAYFSLGPNEMVDMGKSVQAITGVDQERLANLLTQTTERTWELVSSTGQAVGGSVVVAGQSTGEVIVVNAGKVSRIANKAGTGVVEGVSTVTGAAVTLRDQTVNSVTLMAASARKTSVETGQWAAEALAERVRTAADQAYQTGKRVGDGLVTRAEETAGSVYDAGKWMAESLSSGVGKVNRAGRQARRRISAGAGAAVKVARTARKSGSIALGKMRRQIRKKKKRTGKAKESLPSETDTLSKTQIDPADDSLSQK